MKPSVKHTASPHTLSHGPKLAGSSNDALAHSSARCLGWHTVHDTGTWWQAWGPQRIHVNMWVPQELKRDTYKALLSSGKTSWVVLNRNLQYSDVKTELLVSRMGLWTSKQMPLTHHLQPQLMSNYYLDGRAWSMVHMTKSAVQAAVAPCQWPQLCGRLRLHWLYLHVDFIFCLHLRLEHFYGIPLNVLQYMYTVRAQSRHWLQKDC